MGNIDINYEEKYNLKYPDAFLPQSGEIFYYVKPNGNIGKAYFYGFACDKRKYENHNCFRSKEEASLYKLSQK